MARYPIPTTTDQFSFLLRLYFGSNLTDPLACCIDRAYLDFCRTLRGYGKGPRVKQLREQAAKIVRSFLEEVQGMGGIEAKQSWYDNQHLGACLKLCECYHNANCEFFVGQAQKWLNMAVKYMFAFGEERLSGFSHVYNLAHIPLDKIVLGRLVRDELPPLKKAWSRVDSYEDYMHVQRWVRSKYTDSPPLAVEFRLFNGVHLAASAAFAPQTT